MSGEIYTKETSLGSSKCLILPPRSRLVINLNIPNWSKLKLGMFLSKTSVDDPNGVPPSSDEVVSGSIYDFGGLALMSEPDAFPGKAGTFGYSWAGQPTYSKFYNRYRIDGDGVNNGRFGIWNDTGWSAISSTTTHRIHIGRPGSISEGDTLADSFATLLRLAINRGPTSTACSISSPPDSYSDVSSDELASRLGSYSMTSGSSSSTRFHTSPTPYLAFHWPFRNSRLRIHSWRVEVLEPL